MTTEQELYRNIVLNVFRANNLLERIGRKIAAQAGLTSVQQWFILGALYKEGDQSLNELRKNTLVTKQNMTGMVERLKQSGHVTAAEDPHDRRVTRVSITQKGVEALKLMRSLASESNMQTFEKFTSERISLLDDLVEQLVRDLLAQEEQ